MYQRRPPQKRTIYEDFLTPEEAQKRLAEQDENFVKGTLRINVRNYEESYIDDPRGSDYNDILIYGMPDRNRALHGDLVLIQLFPRSDWMVIDYLYQHWKAECRANPIPEAGDAVEEIKRSIQALGLQKTSSETKANATPQSETSLACHATDARKGTTSERRLLSDYPGSALIPERCLQKRGKVVHILKWKHTRTAMGQLRPMKDYNTNWALFAPTDSRIPRMMIPAVQLPDDFFTRTHDYGKYVFLAKIHEWPSTSQMPHGALLQQIGLAGDIEVETEGLLFSKGVDTREFTPESLSSLPIQSQEEWKIDEFEFRYRIDLREETIFTIDPLTARDLDDALHIKACSDIDGKGTPGWEIGVHIADVAHFLLEGTELDEWAKQRATSVYLVHQVVPMLPRLLCEQLCSLNPGVDRLCFSVIWKVDNDATIVDERFARTVIRSRCKLAYEHAQDFLDNPEKLFETSELPELYDGCTPADIGAKVHMLWDVAQKLRAKRVEKGALRLDQPKLKFALDRETKMPTAVGVYQIRDANRLVEEYMLLANTRVAMKISSTYPNFSVLRRHPEPKAKVLAETLALCQNIGFPIDGSSSKILSKELRKFEGKSEVQGAINQVLSLLMMRPMQLAQYFCTGKAASEEHYYHYALATAFYTHFTSPIRRYPDVLVHRLLAAACGYTKPPEVQDPSVLAEICSHCNDCKTNAKAVSDESADMFFGLFVHHAGSIEVKGVVIAVLDAAFDVLVFKYGIVKRVYTNQLPLLGNPFFKKGNPARLTLHWKNDSGPPINQELTICSIVDVVLIPLEDQPTKYKALIKRSTTKGSPDLHSLYKGGVEFLQKPEDQPASERPATPIVDDLLAESVYAEYD
ncbi:unnamed protein product, partial [Mesorhabditis spiculigera]